MSTILTVNEIPESTQLAMWHHVFIRGFYSCPSLGFFSSGVSVLNAILTYANEVSSTGSWSPSTQVYALLLSGLFMFGMVPFTLTWIVPLEEVLLKREKDLIKSGDETKSKIASHDGQSSHAGTRKMLERWVTLNYCRMVMPFVGVLIAWILF